MSNAKQRQLEADWKALLEKHQKPLEKGAKSKGSKVRVKVSTKLDTSYLACPRSTSHMQSKITDGGSTGKPEQKQYTGTAVLGISTLHKSNAIPIFSKEEAIDVARMRRN